MSDFLEAGQSEAGWHRASTFLLCPRRFAMEQAAKASGEARGLSPALVSGTLLHAGLAHLYARRMSGKHDWMEPYAAIQEAARRGDKESPTPLWDEWAERLKDVIPQYVRRWGAERQWEVMGVEEELRVEVMDPRTGASYLYTQRYDLLIRNRSDRQVYIIDHKRGYELAPRIWNRYALSGQIAGYKMLGRVLYGLQFGGVLLNFVQMPGKDDGLDFQFKFMRPSLPQAEQAARDFKGTVIHVERGIAACRDAYGPEQTNATAWPGVFQDGPPCMGPFGPCPFRDYCRTGQTNQPREW